jgi:ubiquinone/menaquinone biosynthesis C-methylase UbiE
VRRTASLNVRNERALRQLILRSQNTFLGPAYSPSYYEKYDSADEFRSAEWEFNDNERFFRHFWGKFGCDQLRGRDVLDVGCGYGGRTVFYALECGVKSIHGIDITQRTVERSAKFAERKGAYNATFSLTSAENMDLADCRFDSVISADTLEHVADPARAIREMHRVLKHDGDAWVVFPTYRGARISHLDYVTRVPMLHRIFHPDTIVKVVNDILVTEGRRLGKERPLGPPSLSTLGHYTLPGLNGMTLREARQLFEQAGFLIQEEWVTPVVDPQLSLDEIRGNLGDSKSLAVIVKGVAQTLHWTGRLMPLPDLLIQNIALHATPRIARDLPSGARR